MPSERAVARADGEGGGGEPSFEKFLHGWTTAVSLQGWPMLYH